MSPKLSRSPTLLSQILLELEGWLVGRVQVFVPGAYRMFDLFGWADLVGVKGEDTGFFQTTSASNLAARLKKISEAETAPIVAEARHRIVEAHGWRYLGRRKFLCRRVEWMPSDQWERHYVIEQLKDGTWKHLGEVEAA